MEFQGSNDRRTIERAIIFVESAEPTFTIPKGAWVAWDYTDNTAVAGIMEDTRGVRVKILRHYTVTNNQGNCMAAGVAMQDIPPTPAGKRGALYRVCCFGFIAEAMSGEFTGNTNGKTFLSHGRTQNKLTNSAFTGSAASWTLTGDWSYNANNVRLFGTPASGTLSQLEADLNFKLVPSWPYRLTYDYVQGGTQEEMYITTTTVDQQLNLPFTTGTHTVEFVTKAGAVDFEIFGSGSAAFSTIDNLWLQPMAAMSRIESSAVGATHVATCVGARGQNISELSVEFENSGAFVRCM